MAMLLPESPRAERPTFTVHVADVGTGLGVFVDGPDFALVYDAGSNDDLAIGAKNRFVAYLKTVKPDLHRIDHVILSHPHRDHVELLADVLSSYEVAEVWDSGAVNPICGYRRFVQAVADEPNVAYHTGVSGPGTHVIDFGKDACPHQTLPAKVSVPHAAQIVEGTATRLGKTASMTILHVDGTVYPGDKFNKNSLVTVLDLDGTKVLLMGDAEAGGRADPSAPDKDVEGYVLSTYPTQVQHADVLIAGHHGSMSSSRKAFIDAVQPKVSVISSGPKQYGSVVLPDPVVRDELAHASTLLETDLHDATCGSNSHKIGPPADGKPGGCDNVQVVVHAGEVHATYMTLPR
jgi:competence protein ComEC